MLVIFVISAKSVQKCGTYKKVESWRVCGRGGALLELKISAKDKQSFSKLLPRRRRGRRIGQEASLALMGRGEIHILDLPLSQLDE